MPDYKIPINTELHKILYVAKCNLGYVKIEPMLYWSVVPLFLPSLPSLIGGVGISIGLVSISTDLVSVRVPDGWLPLAELPWMPVCPVQGLWLKAYCSPWNHRPLWQAPSPSSSIGDELNE